ncbi:4'-phosphopantetheinyl transferase pptA [Psilocybe cubensis]|uniref:4'-phosphopantetheinyl transferase pptA n=1 Tax=Psilocybe cubensis TaxID=181762 RepID=A0ACB8GME7_PSICU|nr:4'-phosphopantetheinyl transferase pptA [Psilocybe cubensis]KAH9476920.1 4'-phosphopantetheinyl transferase pptA [Psilocybe cubensis]
MSYETVLVWMLSLNREYAKIEYDTAYQLCKLCFPNDKYKYDFNNPDSFRMLMTQLLPVLMMRHRRVPRAKWKDHVTPAGKHWIEHIPSESSNRARPPSIGYQLTFHNSLCGMAVTQGTPAQVVNIGLGVKQLKVEPRGTSVPVYFESLSHKLTPLEIANVSNNPDEIVLKRLCMLIALKESYIKAIGQPMGFDYSRLEFDIPNRRATGDGNLLMGWEFRVFGAKLGVARGTILKQEEYECVCAYYRGTVETTFIFHQTPQELENWVQFINIDQLMAVASKLAA